MSLLAGFDLNTEQTILFLLLATPLGVIVIALAIILLMFSKRVKKPSVKNSKSIKWGKTERLVVTILAVLLTAILVIPTY